MAGTFLKLVAVLLMVIACSCRNNAAREGELVFPVADSFPASEAEKLSDEALADIVQNIASPVEIASILQSIEVPYSAEYLASTQHYGGLTTNYQKALMLGIYGADLGYLNMYEKTGTSVDVLSAINHLAEGLRVGQFFDFETISRLSVNRTNLDSLLYISVSSYNKIDEHLRLNGRGSVSALMITGVWIEGQYLATQVVSKYPDKILRDRIGEQKIILNDLLMLLLPYKGSSTEYADLYDNMKQISEAYKDIRITYKLGEPETVEQDGRLVLIQHEESMVDMSDEQLLKVISMTMELRNKLIEGK